MIYLLYFIHISICLFLIMVVLLQQGKGADLSVFGGGATQAAFGARGTASLLHKLTVWGFVAFIVTTISIGFMVSSRSSGSVMSNLPEQSAAATTTEDEVTTEAETEATPADQPADGSGEAEGAEVDDGEPTPKGGTAESDGTPTDDADDSTPDS